MKNNCTKTLMRSGHRNSVDLQRILVYHLVDTNEIKTRKLQSIVEKSLNHNEYYALKVLNNDREYIHIEKDSTVSLTEYPICFFEIEIFDNKFYSKLFGEYLLEIINKSNFTNDVLKIEFEIVSNSKLHEILNIKVM